MSTQKIMGTYRVAQICPNGHVATTAADVYPEFREAFCSQCGEETITQCPNCSAPIRGDYHVEDVLYLGSDYKPPAFCYNCGKAFPWTERKIASAVELVNVQAALSSEELQQFRSDLAELTKNSSKLQVALFRFKHVMSKVGTTIASDVRDIMIDVFSEAVKKAIWG